MNNSITTNNNTSQRTYRALGALFVLLLVSLLFSSREAEQLFQNHDLATTSIKKETNSTTTTTTKKNIIESSTDKDVSRGGTSSTQEAAPLSGIVSVDRTVENSQTTTITAKATSNSGTQKSISSTTTLLESITETPRHDNDAANVSSTLLTDNRLNLLTPPSNQLSNTTSTNTTPSQQDPTSTDTTKTTSSSATTSPRRPPNIVFILTDQQHANMMSAAGNPWVKTPAMDRLATEGIRFTRAYTTNPVCVPARIGLMLGRFPSAVRGRKGNVVRENSNGRSVSHVRTRIQETAMGNSLKDTVYDLIYGGKQHLPGPLLPKAQGFHVISTEERVALGIKAAEWLKQRYNDENNNNVDTDTTSMPTRPFFLWLNFINPHDICQLAIHGFPKTVPKYSNQLTDAMKLPINVTEGEFYAKHCPPLPPNFEPQQDEPNAIGTLLDIRQFRRDAREKATDKAWRHHRWTYARLTEHVDREIQLVLDTIFQQEENNNNHDQNTMIIFSSDHGDMDSAHKMEHKSTLYEEAANVPFIVWWKGVLEPRVDTTHLISNGLDLLPTICDFAGTPCKPHRKGRSIKPLLFDENAPWRTSVGVESQIGRMVVHEDGLKYAVYDISGREEEQLLDLKEDPYELRHYTNSSAHQERLDDMRRIYHKEWFLPELNDS